jgi:sugar lactone lactonase YvrE
VTDTGLKATTTGFEPNGTDAVYRITSSDEVQVVAKGLELGNPNGITVLQDGTVFVNASSGEMYNLQEGQKTDVTILPGNNLDGILELGDGSIINSSWETSSLYKTVKGQTTVLATDMPTPADFGLDTKRSRLLVPIFSEDRIVMIDLLN